MSLGELLASARRGHDGALDVTVPETWLQGRTAYGGLSAALALEAARCLLPQVAPLRSAQIAFVGPVTGAVTAKPRILRQGRNALWIGVQITSAERVVLAATFVFMQPLDSAAVIASPRPPADLVDPAEAAVADSDQRPAFLRHHFETRYALPKAPSPQPDICLWVRLLDRGGLHPETELLLIGDALPPAVLPVMPVRGPVSSMTWQINLFAGAAAAEGEGWWLLRSSADEAARGTSSQHMMIWDAQGRPGASGTQTVAVFA
ncbi:thioesterase family protein [Erythrobacteraceae bacterium CFH 75059]|uniref:thioesterase family protein n=1 Tax=Qipengyuania thermophila TaxID=2509361 RepID=UPI00101F2F49|nr:thioesterase family protein [Qipengyuania thermophila]TCD05234.1 thioesterase family protein [Erythrobacteraceae bacterium CFH 75059]